MPKGLIDSITGSSARATARATEQAGQMSANAQERGLQMQLQSEREARAIQQEASRQAEEFLRTGNEQAKQNMLSLRSQLMSTVERMANEASRIAEGDFSQRGQQLQQEYLQRINDIGSSFDQAMSTVGLGGQGQMGIVQEATNRALQAGQPFAQAGTAGINAFAQSALNPNNPLFQMRLQQGTDTLNKQLAARGMFNSGAGIEAQRRFIEQATAEEQQNQINRQMQLAQLGQPQVGMQQQILQQGGQQMANILGGTSTNLANLLQGRGQTISDIQGQRIGMLNDLGSQLTAARLSNAQNRGNQLMGIEQQTTGAIPQMDLALASNLANIRSGLGNAQAQSLRDVGQAQASSAINIADAINAANINAAKTRQAQGNALMGGIFQLGGAALGNTNIFK